MPFKEQFPIEIPREEGYAKTPRFCIAEVFLERRRNFLPTKTTARHNSMCGHIEIDRASDAFRSDIKL